MSRKLVGGEFIMDTFEESAPIDEEVWRRVQGRDMVDDSDPDPEPEFCNEVCRNAFAAGGFGVHGGCDTCPLADEPE